MSAVCSVGATLPAARPNENSLLAAADRASTDSGATDAGATSPAERHAAEDRSPTSMGSKDEGETSPAARPDENSLLAAADRASPDAGATDAGAADGASTNARATDAGATSKSMRSKDEGAMSPAARPDENSLLAEGDGASMSTDAGTTSPADGTSANVGTRDVRETSPVASGQG